MIHNYYLYEDNGQLSMIPWDYNLAFGGFQSSDATSLVNFPIDTPVSGGTVDSRPMLAWIFNNEEYTELYHEYFQEFITNYFNSGYFEDEITSVQSVISPYVEKDPTKFCTYEEFEKGVSTLKQFCLLRAESIDGQLEGTIPSTSDEQNADGSALIDASSLTITDMGSMGGHGEMNKGTDGNANQGGTQPGQGGTPPGQGSTQSGQGSPQGGMQKPNGDASGSTQSGQQGGGNAPNNMQGASEYMSVQTSSVSTEAWILLGLSVLVLAGGLTFTILYKRRRC
jgi:hypothetical protein